MRRLTGILAAFTLLSGALVMSPAAGATGTKAACAAANMEFVYLETFKVDVKLPTKNPYHPGDKVPFPTTVTRPAEKDPLGQGIPMPRPYVEPAADVPVVIVAFADDVLLIDYKITDENGKVNLALKLPKYTPEGPVGARVYAQKLLQDTNCITIYETGEVTLGHAFHVER
ncbi:MAG TPA: hypothetical protein VHJ76_04885 [Actinomycetota bacterium]|nr:hypothetical protein [Actinomycetota bacterium]